MYHLRAKVKDKVQFMQFTHYYKGIHNGPCDRPLYIASQSLPLQGGGHLPSPTPPPQRRSPLLLLFFFFKKILFILLSPIYNPFPTNYSHLFHFILSHSISYFSLVTMFFDIFNKICLFIELVFISCYYISFYFTKLKMKNIKQ